MSANLGEHKGRPIVGTGIIIRNTGDGLSQAMAVEPRDLDIGDEVYVLVEATCVDMHYPAEDPKYPAIGGLRRIPVLRAGTATFLDPSEATAAIERQKVANREYADRAAGQVTISAAILDAEHADGAHRRLVEGCEACAEEKRLADEEADREREAAALQAQEDAAARVAEREAAK